MLLFTYNKQTSIYFTVIKSSFDQKSTKAPIPSSKSLFEIIEDSFKFKNIIEIFMVLKTRRSRDMDFFICKVIKKILFNIYLIQLKIREADEYQKKSYYSKTDYKSISLFIVNSLSLNIPFCHYVNIISNNYVIFIQFFPKHSSSANDGFIFRTWNNVPNVIFFKLNEIF